MRSPTTILPRRALAGPHALALGLATLLLATGCRFGVNRQLEPGDIRGTLVFETAAGEKLPAADARIVIENSAFATKTDTRGRFVFRKVPVGDYRLQIAYTAGGADNALRLGPVTVKPRDARDLGTLNVTRLGQLRGTIVRGPGNPIRAEIALPGFEPQTTGVDGRFDFARVASGAPWPVLVVAQRADKLAYYDLPPVDVTPGAPTEKEFDLDTLDPLSESDVSTLVRLSGRDDHSGARVRFAGPDGPIDLPATNVDGRLAARLPPGVYTVRVEHDDYLPLVMEFVVVAGETDLPTILLAPDVCADTPDAAGCEDVDTAADADEDGTGDLADNCPSTPNADQLDTDANGIGDACTPIPPDLEPPAAPTFDGTGGLTRDTSVTLTGSVGLDVVTVELFDNDNCTGATPATTVPQSGLFSYEFSLEEGVETEFSARALDAAGNVSPCSDSQHWTSDTKPPLAPTVVSVSPASPSKATAVQVQVRSEPNAFVVGFQEAGCQGNPQAQGSADLTGMITLTFFPVSNVEAFFTFTARDEAGNQGPCGPADPEAYLSDRDPPNADNATLTLAGPTLELAGTQWFGANTDPAPTWDGYVGATRYEYFWAANDTCDSAVSGGILTTANTNAIGDPVPLEVSLAPAYFCLRAQDALGNTTEWKTTGPAQQDRAGPSLGTPFVSGAPTNPAIVTLGSVNDDGGVGLRAQPYEVYLCSDPACTTGPVVEAATDGPTVSVPLQPCVETRIGVRAYDRVGNASNATFTPVTVPMDPPTAFAVSQRFGVVELAWTAPEGPAKRYELCSETTGNTCTSGWTDLGPATSARLYEPHASKGAFGVRAVATTVSGCTSEPVWGTGRPADYIGTLSTSGSMSDRIGAALLVVQDPLGTGARLLVGKPANAFRRGEVRVFRLRPTDGSFSDDGVFLQGDSNGDEFGAALASVGDVDGDGIEDFAVGAPGATEGVAVNTGYVKVFAGRDLQVITKLQVASVPAALRSGTRFGATLAGGAHLAGDGKPDLLIGAPAADPSGATDAGVVHIFHTDGTTWTRENALLAGVAAGQAYGSSLAVVGDLDGDGLSEFFSGSPRIDPGPSAGQAYGGGAITRSGGTWSKYFPTSGAAGDGDYEAYGAWAVPVGDFDGRGKPDYAVGAPEADGGRGKVYVVMGEDLVLDEGQCAPCATNPTACPSACFASNLIHLALEGDVAGGRFGLSGACIGDLDGDGRCELAVASQGNAAVSIHSYDGTQWNLLKRYAGLATSTTGVTVVSGGDPLRSGVAGFAYGALLDSLFPGDNNGLARWFVAPRDATPFPARPPGAPLAPAFDPMTAASQGAPNWVLAGSAIAVSSVLRPSSLAPQGVLTVGGAPFAGTNFDVSPLAAMGPYVPYTLPLAAGLSGKPFSWDMPLHVKAGAARMLTGLGQPTVVVPVGDWTGDLVEDVALGYPSASPDSTNEGAVQVLDGVTGAVVKTFWGGSDSVRLGTSIAKATNGPGSTCLIAAAPGAGWGELRMFCSDTPSGVVPVKLWKDNTSGPPNLGEALVYPGVDLNGSGGPDFVGYSNSSPGVLMFFDRDGAQAPWSTAVGLGGSFEQVGRQLQVVIDGTQALLVAAAVEPALPSGRSGVLVAVNARTGLGQVWRYPPGGTGVSGDELGAQLVKVPDVNGDGVRDLVATSLDLATGNKRLQVISGRGGALVRTIAAPTGSTNWGRALSSEAGAVTAPARVELLVSSAGFAPGSPGLVWVVDLVSGAVVRATAPLDARTMTHGVALTLVPDRDLDLRMEQVIASVASNDGVNSNGALVELVPSAPPPKPTQRPSGMTLSPLPNQAVQLNWTAGRPSGPNTSTHVEFRQPGRAPQVLSGNGGTLSNTQLDALEPGATYFIRVRDYTGGVDPTAWSVTHKYVVPTN